jgi:elongation factor G
LGEKFDVVTVPTEYRERAERDGKSLIEALADYDDGLAEKFLGNGKISEDAIRAAVRHSGQCF